MSSPASGRCVANEGRRLWLVARLLSPAACDPLADRPPDRAGVGVLPAPPTQRGSSAPGRAVSAVGRSAGTGAPCVERPKLLPCTPSDPVRTQLSRPCSVAFADADG